MPRIWSPPAWGDISQSAHSSITAGTKLVSAELQRLEPLLKGKNMHHQAVRYVTRTTAAAASTLATTATSVAAAALAASIILSPAADASARMDGVHSDLARAVQLNQVTPEQAARFEARLAGRILGEA